MAEEKKVKRSRKSRMKKRSDDWDDMKIEVAKELGLWDQVTSGGWSSLSAVDSGRLGGVFSARKKAIDESIAEQDYQDQMLNAESSEDEYFDR